MGDNLLCSAGAGGTSTTTGGGAGGVLVDNTGPAWPDTRTGEGYGGGGNYYTSDELGLPGVVILDFAPE